MYIVKILCDCMIASIVDAFYFSERLVIILQLTKPVPTIDYEKYIFEDNPVTGRRGYISLIENAYKKWKDGRSRWSPCKGLNGDMNFMPVGNAETEVEYLTFYQSSGVNSGEPGKWFPLNGIGGKSSNGGNILKFHTGDVNDRFGGSQLLEEISDDIKKYEDFIIEAIESFYDRIPVLDSDEVREIVDNKNIYGVKFVPIISYEECK